MGKEKALNPHHVVKLRLKGGIHYPLVPGKLYPTQVQRHATVVGDINHKNPNSSIVFINGRQRFCSKDSGKDQSSPSNMRC